MHVYTCTLAHAWMQQSMQLFANVHLVNIFKTTDSQYYFTYMYMYN